MLLPYASDRPTSKPPVTVVILVLLQFVLFAIFAFGVNSSKGSYWINLYASLCLVPAHVHWYSPLTYSFLHERVFHLSANMLFLWVFGSSLEDALKWKKFLSIYLGSAILTGLLQVAITRITHGSDGLIPIVGASGAISSLIGMFAVRFYRSKISIIGLPAKVPAITLLVLTVCIEMGMTIWSIVQKMQGNAMDTTAHWAHIFGFFVGLGIAQSTRMFHSGKQEYLVSDAKTASKSGSPLTAVKRWESVLALQPESHAAMFELAKAWISANDKEHGLQYLKMAIDRVVAQSNKPAFAEYAEFAFEAGLEMGMSVQTLYQTGGWMEEANNPLLAASLFTEITVKHKGSDEIEMATLRLGVIQSKKLNEPQKAIETLENFLQDFPKSDWRKFAEDTLRSIRS